MPRIYVTRQIPGEAINQLRAAFGDDAVGVYESESTIPRDVLLREVAGAEAILAILSEKIDGELLDAAGPQLKVVANMAVGFDNVDVEECTRRGVQVTNTPDVLTRTTADLAFGLMIAASRRFAEGERFLRSGQWHEWTPTLLCGMDVWGKTLGIFGMGRIGRAVAKRARGFGMKVLYCNRTRLNKKQERRLRVKYVSKEELLNRSDFISIHCPLTEETRHAFGASEFRMMKPTAVLVNTARGPVVDEAALADALRSREIFAAGLDVFEREPAVHAALLECENAVLLPHLGSATYATRARMAETAAGNIIAVLQGEAPPNPVNRPDKQPPAPGARATMLAEMTEPVIAGRKSIKLDLEPGTYWWCACGLSRNQPWCDGSHKGSSFRPVEVKVDKPTRMALCSCKHSALGPICDGAHKHLPE